MTDEQCIHAVLNGDKNAFANLIDKYKTMSFNLAKVILRDEIAAQDVLQNVFLSAYTNLNSFRFRSKFSTWLYTIVMRESYRQRRKQKSSPICSLETIANEHIANILVADNEADKHIDAINKRRYIHDALLQLPEKERVAIQLFYLEECSIKELSKILQCSTNNCKVILHRARKKMAILLEPLQRY